MKEKKVVMKYKGVTLSETDVKEFMFTAMRYAVYCTHEGVTLMFPFGTKKEFKDAVNGVHPYSPDTKVDVAYLSMATGNWGYVPIKEFKDFAINNQYK